MIKKNTFVLYLYCIFIVFGDTFEKYRIVSVFPFQGKVKSIYENIKNLLDPTPRFDSHIAKNASKVTSLTCYHAFELTQVRKCIHTPERK